MLQPIRPGFGGASVSIARRPSCAFSMSRNPGIPKVFGVRQDRFVHQVAFIGAVDSARYAVRHIGRQELGFGEVVQTINALCVAVLH